MTSSERLLALALVNGPIVKFVNLKIQHEFQCYAPDRHISLYNPNLAKIRQGSLLASGFTNIVKQGRFRW